MKKMLIDYKDELIEKYGYSEDFAETLSIVTDSICDDTKDEYSDLIWNAVLSCKYSVHQKPEKKISDYSKREGMFISTPTIESSDKGYVITSVNKEIILPSNFDTESISHIGILTNMTLSLVRSAQNEFNIQGNKLKQRQGVMQKEYDIVNEDGSITLTNPVTTGIGLEKGITSYTELSIMRNDFDSNYESSKGSDFERVVAGTLIDGFGLKDTLNKASISGDYSELEAVIRENTGKSLNEFLSVIDELDALEVQRANSTLDSDKLKQSIEKLNRYYENTVAPSIAPLSNAVEHKKEKTM